MLEEIIVREKQDQSSSCVSFPLHNSSSLTHLVADPELDDFMVHGASFYSFLIFYYYFFFSSIHSSYSFLFCFILFILLSFIFLHQLMKYKINIFLALAFFNTISKHVPLVLTISFTCSRCTLFFFFFFSIFQTCSFCFLLMIFFHL
jgi:hypothetical protein